MNIESVISKIKNCSSSLKIMEVCGTHTQAIAKSGIRRILPEVVRLVSGPGCPVCVTVPGFIDKLVDFAFQENCSVLSFGDLFKVKGNEYSFSEAKARGANIQMVYSPLDAIKLALNNKNINYAVAAVGFETTVPVYSILLEQLINEDIKNVKLLTSLKATVPALSYICSQEDIDGFICPGHVAAVIGSKPFENLAAEYKKPFVVAGFEPEHILASIYKIIASTENGSYGMDNYYPSIVNRDGNLQALSMMDKYFELSDFNTAWRGIGKIPNSSYTLKPEYSEFDLGSNDVCCNFEANGCRCGEVLLGRITPVECSLFADVCSPENAVGACMVSGEGACGIWYNNKLDIR